jgi:site-specific recombinase XerD
MRNAEAKLHSIEQITTLVSTLKVMLTPNRDYWTGALALRGTDTRTIQGYLGHNNIQHTVHYTELAPERFRGLWDE